MDNDASFWKDSSQSLQVESLHTSTYSTHAPVRAHTHVQKHFPFPFLPQSSYIFLLALFHIHDFYFINCYYVHISTYVFLNA